MVPYALEVSVPNMDAIPAANAAAGDPNSLFPMLFITVACGACSGFHSLIATGTSSKQLANEKDEATVPVKAPATTPMNARPIIAYSRKLDR